MIYKNSTFQVHLIQSKNIRERLFYILKLFSLTLYLKVLFLKYLLFTFVKRLREYKTTKVHVKVSVHVVYL